MKVIDLGAVEPEGVSHDPAILKRVVLRAGEVPHLTQLARATFEPGQFAPAHHHPDMWEVFVCESGGGSIAIGERRISLSAGTCVLVEPGERHELRNDSDEVLVVTVIGLVR